MIIANIIRPALLLLADQAGQSSIWTNQTLWRVINLLVFVIILIYIFRNKIRIGQVFDDRAATIVKELEQAKHDKEEAQQKLAEVEARLSRLDQEVAGIKQESEREAERERLRISEAAASDAEKLKQTAQREIEGAMKAARTELRAFVAENSVQMAESIIRRDIRPEDDTRMLNKYIDELSGVSK